jgi:uncharacterized membrane protein
MEKAELDAMTFNEKLARLRRGIRIPSPEECRQMQDLDALMEKIERIKRRLSRFE